jgi:hypothetical protein
MFNLSPNVFKQIRSSEISHKELLFSHSIFNVYLGVTYPKLTQPINIYIIELKFIDEVDKFALMQSVNEAESRQKELIRQTTLKRYAYYDEDDTLCLVYHCENYEYLDINSFIKDRQRLNKANEKLIKFELVRQLLEYTKLLHDNGIALHFIHPNLLFYNVENGFVYFDYIIGVIIRETFIKLPKQYDLCNTFINFFGIFHHHERKRVLATKALNKDIILLLIFISYMFSKLEISHEVSQCDTPTPNFRTKFVKKVNKKNFYEVILFNFQKEFLKEDSAFTSFVKYISDQEIKDFILKYCVHKYENSKSIHILYENFLTLFNFEIKNYFTTNPYDVCMDCGLSDDGDFESQQADNNYEEKLTDSNIISESVNISPEEKAKKFQEELDESIKDIEDDNKALKRGMKSNDHLDKTISLKNEELTRTIKKNQFSYFLNKHCFDLICARCCKNHECEFLKESSQEDMRTMNYKKTKEHIDEMRLLYSLSGRIEPKHLTRQYKERGIYTKFEKIVKGHINKECMVKKYEEHMNFLLKNLDKILKVQFYEERAKFEKRFAKATIEVSRDPIRPDMEKILDEVVVNLEKFNNLLEHIENVKRTFRGQQGIFHSFNNMKFHVENYSKKLQSLYQDMVDSTGSLEYELIKLIHSRKESYTRDQSRVHPFFYELQLDEAYKYKYLVYPNIVQHNFNITTPDKEVIKELSFRTTKTKASNYVNFKLVHLKSKFLVTGGKRDNISLSEAYYCNYKGDYTFIDLPNMLHARDNHTMTVYSDIFVIVAGGTNTNTCERLNLLEYNKGWNKLPDLNLPRSEGALAVYNNSYIYLFCGMEYINSLQFTNKIEKLHLYDLEKGWEILNVANSTLPKMKNIGVVCHKSTILILGGLYEIEENNTNQIFKFNCETDKLIDNKNTRCHDRKVKFIFDNNIYRVSDNSYQVYGNDKQSLFKLSYDKI